MTVPNIPVGYFRLTVGYSISVCVYTYRVYPTGRSNEGRRDVWTIIKVAECTITRTEKMARRNSFGDVYSLPPGGLLYHGLLVVLDVSTARTSMSSPELPLSEMSAVSLIKSHITY